MCGKSTYSQTARTPDSSTLSPRSHPLFVRTLYSLAPSTHPRLPIQELDVTFKTGCNIFGSYVWIFTTYNPSAMAGRDRFVSRKYFKK